MEERQRIQREIAQKWLLHLWPKIPLDFCTRSNTHCMYTHVQIHPFILNCRLTVSKVKTSHPEMYIVVFFKTLKGGKWKKINSWEMLTAARKTIWWFAMSDLTRVRGRKPRGKKTGKRREEKERSFWGKKALWLIFKTHDINMWN